VQRFDAEQVFYINKSQRKSRRLNAFFRFVGVSVRSVISIRRAASYAGLN
jgi:hypothetical protein